mmetsp:Transcript_21759/g.35986  ORF Transcript_21759/g.35986 Transcript_21759/m.35986 type:complete len:171 (+) Transcript_21759:201-713(+)
MSNFVPVGSSSEGFVAVKSSASHENPPSPPPNAQQDEIFQPLDFFIPGTASLVEELDKRLLVQLRDGKKLIGILKSFDQFANLVLEDTYERVIIGNTFGDVPLGMYVIRGENVVILGEIDPTRDPPSILRQVSPAEIRAAQRVEEQERRANRTLRIQMAKMELLADFDAV